MLNGAAGTTKPEYTLMGEGERERDEGFVPFCNLIRRKKERLTFNRIVFACPVLLDNKAHERVLVQLFVVSTT